MKRIFRRALVAASSLGVVGGIALTALPASAAPIPVESWGASATGPFTLPPGLLLLGGLAYLLSRRSRRVA